jgi:hypothetical protein
MILLRLVSCAVFHENVRSDRWMGGYELNSTGEIILVAVAIAMLFFGRARGGEPLRILRVWIVGQLYVMTAMSERVFGTAVVIMT